MLETVLPKKITPDPQLESESGPPVQFEVAWQLPYVIKSIYSQLETLANTQLAPFGIGIAVWRILAALWNNGELTNRELAHYISIDVANVSRVSRVIQRDGLIRRRRTEDDQRAVRIMLTKKGKDLVERIIPHATEWQKEALGDFSSADMATLMPLLNRIAGNLNAYSERTARIFASAAAANGDGTAPARARRTVKRRSIIPSR
jgi:DNA-binding MarR family transcriptional regulator